MGESRRAFLPLLQILRRLVPGLALREPDPLVPVFLVYPSVDDGERRIGARVCRIQPRGFLEIGDGGGETLRVRAPVLYPTAQERLVRGWHHRLLLAEGQLLFGRQLDGQGIGDRVR